MNESDNGLSQQARAYFLQQGQRVSKLNELLNSNILTHHIGKWFSVLVEIVLYLLFVFALLFLVSIPTDISTFIELGGGNRLDMSLQNPNFSTAILGLKIVFFIISLPVFFLAFVLGRNRRKNKLIYEASKEVSKMKEEFDNAIKVLKL